MQSGGQTRDWLRVNIDPAEEMTACLHKRRAWLIMEWSSHNIWRERKLGLKVHIKEESKKSYFVCILLKPYHHQRPMLKWHCKNHSHPFIQSDMLFVYSKPNMSWQGKGLKVKGMLFCSCFSRLCSLGKGNCLFYLPSPHLIQEAGPSPSHMAVRRPMLRYQFGFVLRRAMQIGFVMFSLDSKPKALWRHGLNLNWNSVPSLIVLPPLPPDAWALVGETIWTGHWGVRRCNWIKLW